MKSNAAPDFNTSVVNGRTLIDVLLVLVNVSTSSVTVHITLYKAFETYREYADKFPWIKIQHSSGGEILKTRIVLDLPEERINKNLKTFLHHYFCCRCFSSSPRYIEKDGTLTPLKPQNTDPSRGMFAFCLACCYSSKKAKVAVNNGGADGDDNAQEDIVSSFDALHDQQLPNVSTPDTGTMFLQKFKPSPEKVYKYEGLGSETDKPEHADLEILDMGADADADVDADAEDAQAMPGEQQQQQDPGMEGEGDVESSSAPIHSL